ncbi:hypothetical protein IMSAGC002_01325 [Lachnospiraceae bacterium]|nr:hypothetical protein IMSAGC002_01325 [Lachnospiraceae bacterium]
MVAVRFRFRYDGQEEDGNGIGNGGGKKNQGQGHPCKHTVNAECLCIIIAVTLQALGDVDSFYAL